MHCSMKFTHNEIVRVVSPQPFGCTRIGCRCTKVEAPQHPDGPITGEELQVQFLSDSDSEENSLNY
jgi:hypothetical protein